MKSERRVLTCSPGLLPPISRTIINHNQESHRAIWNMRLTNRYQRSSASLQITSILLFHLRPVTPISTKLIPMRITRARAKHANSKPSRYHEIPASHQCSHNLITSLLQHLYEPFSEFLILTITTFTTFSPCYSRFRIPVPTFLIYPICICLWAASRRISWEFHVRHLIWFSVWHTRGVVWTRD